MARFSPVSGTESAMVAMATSLRKEGRRTWFGAGAERGGVGGERSGGEQKRVGEFEGDGGSAEVFVGVGAAGLVGVDDGEGVGNAADLVGQMVVGDDEVEAEGAGFVGGGEGADAGVDGDDEADAGVGGEAEYVGLHAVALADAVRDVVGDLLGLVRFKRQADALDGGLEQDGGGGAVDVVVAVDEDGFGGADRGKDAGYGFRHAKKLGGRMELVDVRVQEGVGVSDIASNEDLGDGDRAADASC